ncbi:MAG: hypothetical protein A2X56_09030 [Nitrospirae bacterium GWC2_57_13]|jgi:hypothetical protein|nr:MAG: hypothetical protein A2X56_09030 [Nitrospirae bacterium GWC2_57_13]OGW46359.1 MAG: hypothetical protein A2X57_05200 [Nitrospirae bacterium GWD2_57_8]
MRTMVLTGLCAMALMFAAGTVSAQQGGMMPEGRQKMPMMEHMQGHGTMMQDIMSMMKRTMEVQRKMLQGMSSQERTDAVKELTVMMEKMNAMMKEHERMMSGGMMMHGMEPEETGKGAGK